MNHNSKLRDRYEAGQSLTEFIIVFPIILAMAAVIMQLCLDHNAKGLLEYAAFMATRTAIVHIPQDEGSQDGAYNVTQGGKKWNSIRLAAVRAILPVAHPDPSISTALNTDALTVMTVATAAGLPTEDYYNRYPWADNHIAIEFQEWKDGQFVEKKATGGSIHFEGGDEDISVLVTYDHYEIFPIHALFYFLGKQENLRTITMQLRCTLPLEGEVVRIRDTSALSKISDVIGESDD